jgi:hypothetical protein
VRNLCRTGAPSPSEEGSASLGENCGRSTADMDVILRVCTNLTKKHAALSNCGRFGIGPPPQKSRSQLAIRSSTADMDVILRPLPPLCQLCGPSGDPKDLIAKSGMGAFGPLPVKSELGRRPKVCHRSDSSTTPLLDRVQIGAPPPTRPSLNNPLPAGKRPPTNPNQKQELAFGC